jgi:ubiquitin-like protein Pup
VTVADGRRVYRLGGVHHNERELGWEGAAMTTRDTGGQRHESRRTEDEEVVDEQSSTDLEERKAKLDDDIDAILDEIDEVVESNAEDFVRGFVQKGGE